MPSSPADEFLWLRSGNETFAGMLEAIEAAKTSIELETYIFVADTLGEMFRASFLRARQRGVDVRVLIDAFGSVTLLDSYWNPLRNAGGEMRWFNPITLRRFQIRNHRKLLVCDRQVVFLGGFNLSLAWKGDGVNEGWRDLGLRIIGPMAAELSDSFDEMFERAEFKHKRFFRLRKRPVPTRTSRARGEVLLSGPGRGRSPIKLAMRQDLVHAQDVQIIAAYFLPPRRLRRALLHVCSRGGRVQLILPGKSDVPLMQLAARSLYQRLLDTGVEIHEYQPQILHAKLVVIDRVVYVGSSNLDTRSLNINYEVMVRLPDEQLSAEARAIFAQDLRHCRTLDAETWRQSRSIWSKLKERWAYLFFARIDPYVARRQLETMP